MQLHISVEHWPPYADHTYPGTNAALLLLSLQKELLQSFMLSGHQAGKLHMPAPVCIQKPLKEFPDGANMHLLVCPSSGCCGQV